MVKDKVTPQAVEYEEIILSAMLCEAKSIDEVLSIPLKAEHFYDENHKTIFNAILNIYNKKQPCNTVTVVRELKTTGFIDSVGGPIAIAKIANKIATTESIDYYCKIVIQEYLRRESWLLFNNAINSVYNKTRDVFDEIESVQQSLFDLIGKTIRKSYSLIAEGIQELMENIETVEQNGLPTGFTDLDKIIYGWNKSDMVIVAARPGMGKTSFVVSSVVELAKKNIPVAIFSIEMAKFQLTQKIVAAETEIPLKDIRTKNLTKEQIQKIKKANQDISKWPLYIDDSSSLSIFEFRAKARRLCQAHNVQLIVVDYLQLMTAPAQNREGEVSTISRLIKATAKELNIPIIALSQINRRSELVKGENNRPKLSDLRESGSIEQDADIVLFLYRPEYYKQYKDEKGNDLRGATEIIVAKHRNGALGSAFAKFIGEITKFTNPDKDDFVTDHPDYQHSPLTEEEF